MDLIYQKDSLKNSINQNDISDAISFDSQCSTNLDTLPILMAENILAVLGLLEPSGVGFKGPFYTVWKLFEHIN